MISEHIDWAAAAMNHPDFENVAIRFDSLCTIRTMLVEWAWGRDAM